MQFGWQEFVALIVVAIAAGHLARRTWRLLSGKELGRCGSCAKCSTTTAKDSGDVISIDSLVESAKD